MREDAKFALDRGYARETLRRLRDRAENVGDDKLANLLNEALRAMVASHA